LSKIHDANEIAEKFVAKQRVVKETNSIGSFRISKDKLKKREDKKIDNANESLGVFPFNPNEESYPDGREGINHSTNDNKLNSRYRKLEGNIMNSTSLSIELFSLEIYKYKSYIFI